MDTSRGNMSTMKDDKDIDKIAIVGDTYARLKGDELTTGTVKAPSDGPIDDNVETVLLQEDGHGCWDVVGSSSDSRGHEDGPRGGSVRSRPSTRAYRQGWDSIFGAKPSKELN